MSIKLAAWIIALTAASALAQDNGPSGFLHGDLMSWTGTPRGGQFTFHVVPDHLYFCSYDERTYIERENQRITMASAEQGDRLEIVSDRKQGSAQCYARTVHILENPRTYVVPGVRPRPPAAKTSPLRPHADLSLSGAVYRITPGALILRSRSGDRQLVRLRPDTSFFAEGQAADPSNLQVNQVVYVRAARTMYGEVEAYQVIWGDILQPEQ
jgi:hypothetical protein